MRIFFRPILLAAALVPLAAALAACSSPAPSPTPSSEESAAPGPAVPDTEPDIRVHLRSYGDWTQLRLKGKGGLVLRSGDKRLETEELTIVQDENGPIVTGLEGPQGKLRIEANGGVFTLGSKTYSGRLVVDQGRLVNVVPMENYVLGVLRGELPLPDVPLEAARAQAIAVRSYTFHYLLQENPVCDVDDTSLFQVYAGLAYAPSDEVLRQGVNSTRGRYLSFENRPLKAYYHSTCGGHTTDVKTGLDRARIACMDGVPCDWCSISKYYRWEARVPSAAVLKAAQLDGELMDVDVIENGPGDRARRLRIVSTHGEKIVHANAFRLEVGPSAIRSTRWLGVESDAGALSLHGAGWGHGVGLCQMGAIGRGRDGQKGEDIVLAYYPGAKLVRAY
jgi:stage II sporulation protein D